MGLFDKVKGSKEAEHVKLNKEEAFAAVSLAAIAADGEITPDEARGLVTSLLRMKLFSNYNDKNMAAMFNKLTGIIKREGVESLVTSSKEVLQADLRETAFAVAADLTLADGVLAKGEKDILTKIQESLEVPEDKAVNIIEVMLIKNRG
ncbi:MAG: Tellurite resistance protein TerB [Methanomethylovorans sp. PtaU1.Bin093]|jgi:tellurite resistance protein|uniref:tellurite resistance TerB family protein n=1 Tax=Methanomethylovorans sp. PtaU1.Bin093 TaxID=1811679 RepID=UPI0009D2B3DC|nr:tellurite resistance TerB family protein [Methanomethylovorans sp. PtaU1.Bin093]OPY17796.1 MAG: Tellurite resistance protein TerB [Methanomethylovorans sp. PtaU1.Bin093]